MEIACSLLRRARAAHDRRRQPVARRRHRRPLDAEAGTRTATYWEKWYPADWVSESFPGQFRNWFYALLTMSTVMTGRAPFKTLFAYALMRDEHGEEMHKSKGNAIWFDDAAEQIGADVMRWMFAATNPSTNLNFGYGPAHEVVRRFFLPLWNTYGFFVTYAGLDRWTPDQTDGVDGARTILDRWILSRLDGLVGEVRAALDAYDADARRRARSRASSTSCPTGTCAATAAASGRASSTPTSAPPTPRSTRC